MNPILNATKIMPMITAYKQFCSAGNPMQAFMQMAQNNPQMKPYVDLIKSGGNPEKIARQLLQQNGINPDDFIKSLVGS